MTKKSRFCCEKMRAHLNWACSDHSSAFECPDALIGRFGATGRYGLYIHDGGSALLEIDFCPWCGARLAALQPSMSAKVVDIDCREITDWDSLHATFADRLGFLRSYGRNMDAWIDCFTSVDDAGAGMSEVTISPGCVLVLQLDHSKDLRGRLPDLYDAIVECSAFVNWRRIERGEEPVLSLAFHE
jgi:hypothetical protein